jgi:outer membrane biogenesis lipoprotein LolB
MGEAVKRLLVISLLLLTACSTTFRVPKVQDMPDKSIGSVDYGPKEPVK